jgi:putative endonuclease
MTNAYNKVLYTGVTNDLERRCYEHKYKIVKGFTQKYNVDKLVYFEKFDFIDLAISREKQIKGYSRAKKIELINILNKEWKELYSNKRLVIPNLG